MLTPDESRARVLNIRLKALADGDMSIVRECNAYLLVLGADPDQPETTTTSTVEIAAPSSPRRGRPKKAM